MLFIYVQGTKVIVCIIQASDAIIMKLEKIIIFPTTVFKLDTLNEKFVTSLSNLEKIVGTRFSNFQTVLPLVAICAIY